MKNGNSFFLLFFVMLLSEGFDYDKGLVIDEEFFVLNAINGFQFFFLFIFTRYLEKVFSPFVKNLIDLKKAFKPDPNFKI